MKRIEIKCEKMAADVSHTDKHAHARTHPLRKGDNQCVTLAKETISKIDANVSFLTLLLNSTNNICRYLFYLLMYLRKALELVRKKGKAITSSEKMFFSYLFVFFSFFMIIVPVNIDDCRWFIFLSLEITSTFLFKQLNKFWKLKKKKKT